MPKDRSGKSEGGFPNGLLIAGICFVVALGIGIGIGWLVWGGKNSKSDEPYWAPPVPPTPPAPEYPSHEEDYSSSNVPAEEPRTAVGPTATARPEGPGEQANPQVQVAPTLVVFSQPHCPACRAFSPTWEQLKAELENSPVETVKIEDDGEMQKNGVSGIPTVRLYPFGYTSGSNRFATHQGDRSKENVLQFVQGTMTQVMSSSQPQQSASPQQQSAGQTGMHHQYHQRTF